MEEVFSLLMALWMVTVPKETDMLDYLNLLTGSSFAIIGII